MMFPHQGGPETNAQPYKVWGLPQVGTHGAARVGIQNRPKYSDIGGSAPFWTGAPFGPAALALNT